MRVDPGQGQGQKKWADPGPARPLDSLLGDHDMVLAEHSLNGLSAHHFVVRILHHSDDTGFGVRYVVRFTFDVILDDEAMQSLEAVKVRLEL